MSTSSLSMRVHRGLPALAVLTLTLALLASLLGPAQAQPEEVGGAPLAPADGTPSATIRRTSFGIPHIIARDWTSMGFGNGYATAEDAACNLADTLLTARGERSKYLGPDGIYDDQVTLRATNLQVDTFVQALRDRGVVEQLLETPDAAPSQRVRAIVEGYVAGVNQYLEDVGGAAGITDPRCAGAEWIRPAEPLDLYYGIYLANLLASAGFLLTNIVEATPPSPEDPGLPFDPGLLGLPDIFPPGEFQTPEDIAAAIDVDAVDREALLANLGRDPERTFGSNGTALGSDATGTGRGMVLGNPHFPWRGRYRFHQAQLTIPGAYDVAGGMLTGSPVVNIGWNHQVAWTHTVSTAYRFTPYEYRLAGPTTYVTDAGPQELETQEVTVEVLGEDGQVSEVTRTLYRTGEGWVIDAPELFMGWSLASVWAIRDANGEHLRTLDVFLEMGEAGDVQELLDAHTRTGGMPWVNTMAADRDGNALYADHSVVPNVPDDMVQTCATPVGQVLLQVAGLPGLDGTRAQSSCAWGTDEDAARPGIFGYDNLPHTIRTDWVINANDSYWLPNPDEPLEGFATIIGCEQCIRSLRTRMVYRYAIDRLDGTDGFGGDNVFTHEQLQDVEVENRVFAAELAREDDDLQDVCAASGVAQEACDVLAGWDGRTNTDSVGAILFREFWGRVPADPWTVAFDAADPVNTPRDLDEGNADVQQAMVDAVTALNEAGIPLDAALGDQQVAADQAGASDIAIHGGFGSTGSANVVSTAAPIDGVDAEYQIAYGSSHIQAVAFTDDGVEAATILTYGNDDNPTSPHDTDQTRLWSDEQWVDWAFTDAEQLADPGYRAYRVVQGVGHEDLTPLSAASDPGRSDDVTVDPPLRADRAWGPERIATSVAVSRRTFAVADTVVLARADEPVDALTGSPLAASVDGPILLSRQEGVPDDVLAEIDRLGAGRVILLGGEAALPAGIAAELEGLGVTVERLAGPTRIETAQAIAEALPDSDLGYVAPAGDATLTMAAAGAAAVLGAPVLLTEDGAPPATVGAAEVVVAEDLGITGIAADALARGLEPRAVWVVAADAVVDGLGAAAAAAEKDTIAVLVEDGGDNDAVVDALAGVDLDTLLAAGGTAVLSQATLDDLVAQLDS